MQLHHLRPAKGSKKRKIRVGRGEAGRRGKTAGRGTKGLKARSKVRQGFEGGQTPLQRRIPKLKGFKNPNRVEYTVVNVERLSKFTDGTTVTPGDLRDAGLVKQRGRVKVLGQGDLDVALTVKAHAFSGGAVDKITAAGGSIELIE
ncbi:MAG: 50S ribosomal protein L15 [Actinomycetota bacterium]|nr:50S ribosomal protein L15 [Actinomycetota bacterium]MDK1016276.1 50S ribosomal protein L15 [Actinomycetota bacterium]MDK1026032.1 50S ribosomal protein L15 [Actinomycetota bacterium]MDK1037856.1 50S ribosomal protein L15 [Actinomycetota bacterium]MDK1096873.1 50S ribosomal protein L15 [Actinomycetota bacterium]